MSALAVVSRLADQDTDDLDLVARVRAGDDRAFELLFLRYQPRIAAHVRGMLSDPGRAEDITQEVFMAALRRMRATDREIAFKPWIYEIAKNACIDSFRRSRGRDEISFDARDALGPDDVGRLAGPGATPDSVVEGKVAFDNLCGAFGGLSPIHHEVLVMREFEGLSYREIGERMGMSRPAVESTLFRARRRLSEEYEELVSGERCRRVQRMIDAERGASAGLRDQRRLARHLAHCQPCRRYAGLAGVDVDAVAKRPGAAAAAAAKAARIAALVPLPLFLRRRSGAEEASQVLGGQSAPVAQWTASVAGTLDPALVAGWTKAVATAAAVAVAGVGAGAAMTERDALKGFIAQVPAVVSGPTSGPAQSLSGSGRAGASVAVLRRSATSGGERAGVARITPGAGGSRGIAARVGAIVGGSLPGAGPRRPGDAAPAATRPHRGDGAEKKTTGVTDELPVPQLPAAPVAGDAGGAPDGDTAIVSGQREHQRALRRLIGKLRDAGAGGAATAPAQTATSATPGLPSLISPSSTAEAPSGAVAESVPSARTATDLAGTVSGVTGALPPTLTPAPPPS